MKKNAPFWRGYKEFEDSPSPVDQASFGSHNDPAISGWFDRALANMPGGFERQSSDAVEGEDVRGAVGGVAPHDSSGAVREEGTSKGDARGATGGAQSLVEESDREAAWKAMPPSEAEKRGLFKDTEYFEHYRNREHALKGFSFMHVGDIDGTAMTWPDGGMFPSTNPYFLRGLAVTYFYQSKMAKARQLLLEVWKSIQDLDVALMLAECACAIPDKGPETFEEALGRVCRFVTDSKIPATSYHIDYLCEKLRDNGRFMGFIILRYALYSKRSKTESGILQLAILRFTLLKTSAVLLSKVIHHVEAETTQLDKAILFIFEQLKILGITGSPYLRKRCYMEAFSHNCLAWICMRNKKYIYGMTYVNKGLSIIGEDCGAGKVEFMLYGDLLLNKAALFTEQSRLEEAKKFFDGAKSVYRKTMADHPDEQSKSRAIAALAQDCVMWERTSVVQSL